MNYHQPLYETKVVKEWVDFNGHMADAYYAVVFSLAVGELMDAIGIDEKFRRTENYTIYTLETHLLYLLETMEGEPLSVYVTLVDYDHNKLHVIFEMYDTKDNRLATSEQLLIGIDQNIRRSAPFPAIIKENIKQLAIASKEKQLPKEVGRKISIHKQ